MSFMPSLFRYLTPWISNDAKLARKNLRHARAILEPILEQRKQAKAEAVKNGKPAPIYDDMLEWLEQESQGTELDHVVYQMSLSFAAIHTTSNLLGQVITRLANEPHLITELRKEIIEVLSTERFTKAALVNLKLMDSAIKETQRLAPLNTSKYPLSMRPTNSNKYFS
jgi:cytochrome P450